MIRRVSKKQQEKIAKKREDTERQWLFFLEIWNGLKDKRCWQCGRWLGKEPLSIFFDHLIEKSKRPDLRYEKDNIFICCGDCHTKKGNGFPGDKHEAAIQKAREMFD